jgi:hypothetical protein
MTAPIGISPLEAQPVDGDRTPKAIRRRADSRANLLCTLFDFTYGVLNQILMQAKPKINTKPGT